MTTLLSKKKQDERNLRVLRELVSLPYNRQCFDCHQRGPTYVNMTIGSFICTTCSGILRGLNPPHRVKSITMASFSQDEIDMIKNKGNEVCQKVWLGLKVPSEILEPVDKNEAHMKDLLVMKYEKKQFYVDPNSSPDEKINSISQNSNATTSINPPSFKSLSHSFDIGLIEENFLNSGNDVLNAEKQSQQNHMSSTFTISPDAFKKNINVDLLIDPFSEKNDNKLNRQSEHFANFENNPVFNKNNFQNTNKCNQHSQTNSPYSPFPSLNHLKSRWITFESESYESLPNVTLDTFLGFRLKKLSNQDTVNNVFNFSINHYDDPIVVNDKYQNTDLNLVSQKCPLCNNSSSQVKDHLCSSTSINFPDTLHSTEAQSKVSNSSASSPDRYAALAALDNELKAHLNVNMEESSPNNINRNFDVLSNSSVNSLNAFSNSFQDPSKSSKLSSPNCTTNINPTSYNATRLSANPFSVCTAALATSAVLHLSGISTPSVSKASTGNSIICPVPFMSGSSVQYSQFPSQLRPQIVSQHNWATCLQTEKVNPFLNKNLHNNLRPPFNPFL